MGAAPLRSIYMAENVNRPGVQYMVDNLQGDNDDGPRHHQVIKDLDLYNFSLVQPCDGGF
jgi:hypothetical protein